MARAGFGPFLAVRFAGDDRQTSPITLVDVPNGADVMDGWVRRRGDELRASGCRDSDIVMVDGRPILAPEAYSLPHEGGRRFADAPGTCTRCIQRSLGGCRALNA